MNRQRQIVSVFLAISMLTFCACKQTSFSQRGEYPLVSPLSNQYYHTDQEVRNLNGLAELDTGRIDGTTREITAPLGSPSNWMQPLGPTSIVYNHEADSSSSRLASSNMPQQGQSSGGPNSNPMLRQQQYPQPQPHPQPNLPQRPQVSSTPDYQYLANPNFVPPAAVSNNGYAPAPTGRPATTQQRRNPQPYSGGPVYDSGMPSPDQRMQSLQPGAVDPYSQFPPAEYENAYPPQNQPPMYRGSEPIKKKGSLFQRVGYDRSAENEPVPELAGNNRTDWTEQLTVDPSLANRPLHNGITKSDRPYDPQTEYLADGGDDGQKASVRTDNLLSGVDPEDTIIYYDDPQGQKVIQPSNRVQIYSPRFGSVRKVEGLSVNEQKALASATQGNLQLQFGAKSQFPGNTEQDTTTNYTRNRLQLEQTLARDRGGQISSQKGLEQFKATELPRGFSSFLHQSEIGQSDRLALNQGKINADVWSGTQGLLVRVNTVSLKEMVGVDETQFVFSVDDQTYHSREIRLLKVASTDHARPGETVEFALRFENTGTDELRNVTLIDSLTTRLEFLPGSAKSSLPAGFFVEPNEAGSFLLRWELKEPLRAREFGVITFECRVR